MTTLTEQEAADHLARVVFDVVDSFTNPDGEFIHDDLTTVEYESLRDALETYRAAQSGVASRSPTGEENDG